MYLLLIHSLLLAGGSYAIARRLWTRPGDRLLAAAVFFWTNVVVNSLLLAALHRLGDPHWFFRSSLALAALTVALVHRFGPAQEPSLPGGDDRGLPSGWLAAAFVLTLAPLVWFSVRIAATYVPNNYDSLAYHLPRVMFYLGQDSLAHFSTGNARQVYFPFNFNLLQLFGLIYGPPLQALNFLNLVTWGVAGVAVYRLTRLCGFRSNPALIATWVALTSTQVLAQATATTNDLPTSAGLLGVLVFVLRWRETRLRRDALLAGVAAGLTVGSKLTVIFFAPASGLIVLWLGWQHWQRDETPAYVRGIRAWVIPGLLALLLAAPFAIINLAEKGRWMTAKYDYTLNRPFSVASTIQTSEAYLAQLFLEPLHRFTFDPKFTERLNAWGGQTLFPHWNEAYAFSPFYLFPPDLNEDHVWFGFAGPVILLCAFFCLLQFRRRPAPLAWLAALGLGWFATYFLLNRWSLYNQRYFVLAILVMSPCVALLVEAGGAGTFRRRLARWLLVALAASALWLAGIYLFQNSSRPYAPLWAGLPPPPALPELPKLLARRLAPQPWVNVDSSDGNERIFVMMTQGRNQRFTAFAHTVPEAFNLYSEWGFPRKVAYSNIEQPSSYTLVHLPAKRTAGVEFLGTIGSGQPAVDYYGLVPEAGFVDAGEDNRNVLVVLYYQEREPGRYSKMRVKVAGLNEADHARLVLGVEYPDKTTETLATLTQTGEAPASVMRPFSRFTVQVQDRTDGTRLGSIDIPYLERNLPAYVEAPHDPALLFVDEFILPSSDSLSKVTGLSVREGPYPQWKLPLIRWAKSPVVRIEVPATDQLAQLQVSFDVRLEARDHATLDVVHNGHLVESFQLEGSANWSAQSVLLPAQPGVNVIELRNVRAGTELDWLDYLERYPDVKAYLLAQKMPLEAGAQEHYELHGRAENRRVFTKRTTETLSDPAQLYYLFSSLRITGQRNP